MERTSSLVDTHPEGGGIIDNDFNSANMGRLPERIINGKREIFLPVVGWVSGEPVTEEQWERLKKGRHYWETT